MVKCNFCGNDLPLGGGKIYAKKDGSTYYLCSNKCEKNLIMLKRKPVKTKWTQAHNKLKKTLLTAKEHEKEKKVAEKAKEEKK
jgi:large subunit ribosomal protein L24e